MGMGGCTGCADEGASLVLQKYNSSSSESIEHEKPYRR